MAAWPGDRSLGSKRRGSCRIPRRSGGGRGLDRAPGLGSSLRPPSPPAAPPRAETATSSPSHATPPASWPSQGNLS